MWWDWVNFLLSSLMFCVLGFLTRRVLIKPCFISGWALLVQPEGLPSQASWSGQGAGRGYSWDSWPQLTKGIAHVESCLAIKVLGVGFSEVAVAWRLAGHQSAGRRWWVITSASFMFCFGVLLLLFFNVFLWLQLLNCLCIDPWVSFTFLLGGSLASGQVSPLLRLL